MTCDDLSKSNKWNKILREKKGSLIVSGRRYKIRRPPGQNFFLVAKVRHEINLAEIILTQGCQPPKFLNIDNS